MHIQKQKSENVQEKENIDTDDADQWVKSLSFRLMPIKWNEENKKKPRNNNVLSPEKNNPF